MTDPHHSKTVRTIDNMSIENEKLKLNKYIAYSGICGRNQASVWIKSGFVKVNDVVVKEPYVEVGDGDIVTVKNKQVVPKKNYTYIVINKPWRMPIASDVDNNISGVQDLIKKLTNKPIVALGSPVEHTCGLVVMTDDVELMAKIKSSEGHKLKTVYEVTLDKPWSKDDEPSADSPLQMNEVKIRGIQNFDPENENKVGVEMLGGLYEDVVDYFTSKNYSITKLDCTSFSGITKKDLKRGWSRMLSEKEVVFIKHFS